MNMKLVSLFLTSLLLSLGGAGAAATVKSYIRSHVEAADLAPLDDVTPTPTPTPTETVTVTPTPTPTPAGQSPLGGASVTKGEEESEDHSQEELHESAQAKLHEHEHGETEIDEK